MRDAVAVPDARIDGDTSAPASDDLRPIIPPALDDNRRARTLFQCASVIASLMLHVGAAAALLVWFEARPGATATIVEAITVELVPSEVIEAAQPAPSTPTSAAATTTDVQAGSADDARAQQETDDPKPVAEQSPPRVEEAPQPVIEPLRDITTSSASTSAPPDETQLADQPRAPATTARADEALALAEPPAEDVPVTSPEPHVAPRSTDDRPTETPPVAAPTPPTPSTKAPAKNAIPSKSKAVAPSRKGGDPSRASRASKSTSARASASTGAALNYAAIVRARVSAHRPSGLGARGSVSVIFSVSPSGGLAFARITRSSGDRALDGSVLAAIRSASPFPPPPAGASPGQRTFSMPFDFR